MVEFQKASQGCSIRLVRLFLRLRDDRKPISVNQHHASDTRFDLIVEVIAVLCDFHRHRIGRLQLLDETPYARLLKRKTFQPISFAFRQETNDKIRFM